MSTNSRAVTRSCRAPIDSSAWERRFSFRTTRPCSFSSRNPPQARTPSLSAFAEATEASTRPSPLVMSTVSTVISGIAVRPAVDVGPALKFDFTVIHSRTGWRWYSAPHDCCTGPDCRRFTAEGQLTARPLTVRLSRHRETVDRPHRRCRTLVCIPVARLTSRISTQLWERRTRRASQIRITRKPASRTPIIVIGHPASVPVKRS